MHRAALPDGLGVWALSTFEARVLHREIVAEQTYQRHGITLEHGARVFDVGANIGLYAIHLARTIGDVRIRCFEPVPSTFEVLTRNLVEHVPGAVAVQAGLGAASGEATFDVDRFASIAATMHPEVFAPARGVPVSRWAGAALADFNRVESTATLRVLEAGVARAWSRPLVLLLLAPVYAGLVIRKRLYQRRLRCSLRTLSAELAASGFDRIDLVKIDVEGAEEEVLRGIDSADWPRIRQFVIEVHDVEGRTGRMTALLRDRGYRVTTDREDWDMHELMGISTLYAVRA